MPLARTTNSRIAIFTSVSRSLHLLHTILFHISPFHFHIRVEKMQLTASGDISIVEIVVYLPLLVAAVAVCLRHGFKKAEGWIFLVAVCVSPLLLATIGVLARL